MVVFAPLYLSDFATAIFADDTRVLWNGTIECANDYEDNLQQRDSMYRFVVILVLSKPA